MPSYQRFEDLPVWQTAARLYEACDDFLAAAPSRLRSSTRDQLERAVPSVSNNIAEGFERGTTNELLAFIHIARGSAGEVRSMLLLLSSRSWISDFKSQISVSKSPREPRPTGEPSPARERSPALEPSAPGEPSPSLNPKPPIVGCQSSMMDGQSRITHLIELAESCSRQLRAWADSLQNSAITGPRHLNEKTRTSYQQRKSREASAAKFQTLLAQTLPAGHPARPKS